MKSLKVIICLIVVSSLFVEIDARAKNLLLHQQYKVNKAQSKWWEKVWKNWSDAVIKVTTAEKVSASYSAQIQFVPVDGRVLEENPLGIGFQDWKQTSPADSTRFITQALASKNNLQVLDFRLIKDCNIQDNTDAAPIVNKLQEKRLLFFSFEVFGKEEYYKDQNPYNQNKKTYNIRIEMPNVSVELAQILKNGFENLCVTRSAQMNGLKDKAINTGAQFKGLYDIYQSRQLSLQQQAQLGAKQEKILEEVRIKSQQRQVEINIQITTNQKVLSETITKLQQITNQNVVAQADFDNVSKQLYSFKMNLQSLESSQTQIQNQIKITQQRLNEAEQLQKFLLQQAQSVQVNNANIQKQSEADKAAYQKLLAEQEARTKALQAEIAQRQKEQEQVLIQKKQEAEALSKQLSSTTNNIQGLKVILEQQTRQVNTVNEQQAIVKQQVDTLQRKLSEKISLSQRLTNQIEQFKLQKDQYEKQVTILIQVNNQELATLKQKELEYINLLKGNQTQIAALKKEAEEANALALSLRQAFEEALKAIDKFSAPAQVRTLRALQNIGTDQFAYEIEQIQSNSKRQITASKKRMAKIKQENIRMAKILRHTAEVVRLQRAKKAQRRARRQRRH